MGKSHSESKQKSIELKRTKQEDKARKKRLKRSHEEDISTLLQRHVKNSKSQDVPPGKWVALEADNRPEPKAGASFTLCNGDFAILFGGEFYDGNQVHVYNDTWQYNLKRNQWYRLETLYKPLPRCSHQAVYFNNAIYIFGGEFATLEQFHHFNDIHRLCLKTLKWEKIEAGGDVPSARSGHRMVLYKGYWVLFGGFHDTLKEIHYYNDVYIFCFKDCHWKRICQARFSSALPVTRGACLFVAVPNATHAIMHGGFTKIKDNKKNVSGVHHQDSWILDLEAVCTKDCSNLLVWEKVNLSNKPAASVGLGVAMYKTFAVVFGGVKDLQNDSTSIKSQFFNHAYLLNTLQRRFYPLLPQPNDIVEEIKNASLVPNSPPPRMNAHVLVNSNTLYIYGGIVEERNVEVTLSDMWSFDLGKRDGWKCIDAGIDFKNIFKGEISSDSEGMDMDEDENDDGGDEENGSSDEDTSMDSDSENEDSDSSEGEDFEESNDADGRENQNSKFKGINEPIPKKKEKLGDYYSRTKDYWLTCQSCDNKTEKEMKTESFQACRLFYEGYMS